MEIKILPAATGVSHAPLGYTGVTGARESEANILLPQGPLGAVIGGTIPMDTSSPRRPVWHQWATKIWYGVAGFWAFLLLGLAVGAATGMNAIPDQPINFAGGLALAGLSFAMARTYGPSRK